MSTQLTNGCIQTILQGEQIERPIVQFLNHKKISTNNNSERYRVIISDGKWFNSFAMLATQLNDMLTSNELTEFSIIRLDNYICSELPANNQKNPSGSAPKKKIIVILGLTVIQDGNSIGMKLGEPEMYNGENAGPVSSNSATPMDTTPSENSLAGSPNQKLYNGTTQTAISPKPTNNDSNAPGIVVPIISLNPYQGKWCIKARVASKSSIRKWSNARGEGKLFSMDLVDKSGGIRITAFTESVDKFHDMLEVNKLYYFSGCSVKPANKKFTTLPHDFELQFTNNTQVIPCTDDDVSIPQIQYNFTHLCTLKDLAPDSLVDIIGICQHTGDVQTLVARASKRELKKRDILLVDQTDASVTLTLWGTQAEEFDGSTMPVVAVKGARITEFNGGKSVGIGVNSTMQLNPDIEQSHKLRGWFDSLGDNHQFDNISKAVGDGAGGKVYLLKEINTHNLGMQDKADFFSCESAVLYVPHERAIYQACPNADCKKKVVDQMDQTYRCEKCNETFNNFLYRLILNIQICDWTGSQWISLFQEQAETLLGATAQEVGSSRENFGENTYEAYFKRPLFKYFNFRIRAKMDTYNNESRLRLTAVGIKPIDFKEANKRLLNEIKTLSGVSISRVHK